MSRNTLLILGSLAVASVVLMRCARDTSRGVVVAETCDCCSYSMVVSDGDTFRLNGGLVSTQFDDLDHLLQLVDIEYFDEQGNDSISDRVRVVHCNNGIKVISELNAGISQEEMREAADEGTWAQISLALRHPYLLAKREDLLRIYLLSRRKYNIMGSGDVAFYDFAEESVRRMHGFEEGEIRTRDLTEKGYLNTFNHITAQAFFTTLFSEEIAEFVADVHERQNMPELITGAFTEEQMVSTIQNPVDNYVDMINNEWGQELGKRLKLKYNINEGTVWTPELLAAYLNDIQGYYTWSFQLAFVPFSPEDEKVKRFSQKINDVMQDVSNEVIY